MFIHTFDLSMKIKLEQNGYKLVNKNTVNGREVFIFVDIKKINFNREEESKIIFTNKLHFA